MSKPVEITDESFDKITKENSLVVVDCWAPWCGPCRMIGPIIDELATEMEGKIVFVKLNVDENQQTTARFGIMSIPTLLVMKNGKEADRIVGFNAKNALTAKLEAHL
ncbi:MAG: thioredoxin [Candidatus Thermoplasmatota archaeon]|jgi:thioredoxin 1|nr:thioredoxin [Candidatus Thermoplasmatota archaeon]